MVLYFSATGNTAFIAKQIAKRIGDETMNLLPRIQRQDFSEIRSEKPFVICTPVHVCEMPRFLAKYLKEVTLSGNRKVYFIFTSGGYTGISASLAKGIVRKKRMIYMGRSEFRMPRNYPVSRLYPMLPDEEVKARLLKAAHKIPKTAAKIRNGKRLGGRPVTLLEKLITLPFNPLWEKYMHPTKPFYTTDRCIGCGKCARLCPLNKITMEDGRPRWEGSCAHCMACLGNCPFDAIEYRGRSEKQSKYRIDKYVKKKYLI